MKREERMRRMHGHGLTCEQIADVEGISTQKVAQILRPAKVNRRASILLASSAAAAYLGLHPNTLRRWTGKGRIQCIRLANNRGDRRYTRQELDRFLNR